MKSGWSYRIGGSLALALGLQAAVTYKNDFQTTEVGDTPLDFLILAGQFAVADFEGNRVLQLPGAPLDTYGLLLGSSAREDVAVSARVYGTRSGRRFPVFAVSLGGVSGFRLQSAPAKKAVELLQGDTVLQSAPWNWESASWTWLRLQVERTSDSTWRIQGKAWKAGEDEPEDWLLTRAHSKQPVPGKAGIWGKPFSGTPILFDDVKVETVASDVTAELAIPAAETHVIGDATPLLWRFRNNSDEPLAFMWEGCCRLNGRLNVNSESGQPIDLIPPGQALAHMFAKAERLEPAVVSEYDTRVSDWVRLSASGRYRLQGRYTGVLPTQQPQVPRDLALWRAAAVTPPIEFAVIGVDDYLRQRDERIERRGLQMTLNGDPTVLPPDPITLEWELRNLINREQTLRWPDDLQFWLVNAEGFRVVGVPAFFEDDYEEVTLAPNQTFRRRLELDPIRYFEGVPFGDYRVFLDLAGSTSDQPRVPSNPIAMVWRLEEPLIADLVARAASGSRLGFRNAPLKLLRVYLGEIGAQLERVAQTVTEPGARELARELWQASRLKPLATKPGAITWPIALAAEGRWHMEEPRLDSVAREFPAESRLADLFGLRRHLGWSVGLSLEPSGEVPLSEVFRVAEEFQAVLGPTSGWLRAGTQGDLTNRLGGVALRSTPVPAVGLLQLGSGGALPSLQAVVSSDTTLRAYEALMQEPGRSISDTGQLQDWLGRLPAGAPVQIVAEASLRWGQVTHRLEPLFRRTDPVVLSPSP